MLERAWPHFYFWIVDPTAGTSVSEHASLPYNPNVANAFLRAGAIEAWGRGAQRQSRGAAILRPLTLAETTRVSCRTTDSL